MRNSISSEKFYFELPNANLEILKSQLAAEFPIRNDCRACYWEFLFWAAAAPNAILVGMCVCYLWMVFVFSRCCADCCSQTCSCGCVCLCVWLVRMSILSSHCADCCPRMCVCVMVCVCECVCVCVSLLNLSILSRCYADWCPRKCVCVYVCACDFWALIFWAAAAPIAVPECVCVCVCV